MDDHVSRNELDHALAHVLAAPKNHATVEFLCRRPDRNQREFLSQLRLTVKGGVVGDYAMRSPWLKRPDGSPDPRIQVSILPLQVLNLVWRNRDKTPYPGDTIVADLNMSLANMPVGTLLKIGSAVVGVSDIWNNGCAKWKIRYGKEAQDWVSAPEHEPLRLRGIYCWIEREGDIRKGDRITKL